MPGFSTLHVLNTNNFALHTSLSHKYIITGKRPLMCVNAGNLKMERIPTFIHTYSNIPNVPKGKRGRDSTSPTGKTPQQESKKQILKVPSF